MGFCLACFVLGPVPSTLDVEMAIGRFIDDTHTLALRGSRRIGKESVVG